MKNLTLEIARRGARALALPVLSVVGADAAAQCSSEAVLRYLDAGVSAPRLRTPLGAAVIGGPFGFRVHDAPPNMLGILIYSGFEDPVFDPVLGATVWPELPWFTWLFGTGPSGDSPVFLNTPEVTDDLCGVEATFQAVVVEPLAPAGVVVTNAVRLRVGDVTEPVFGPSQEATPVTFEHLAFGDVDGDGVRDMLTGGGTMTVAFGLQSGGFHPTNFFAFVGSSLRAPLVADMNGDGHADLVGVRSSAIEVALLDAQAQVVVDSTFPTSAGAKDAAVADFDLDGLLDVVVTSGSGGLALLEGAGAGLLKVPQGLAVGAPQTEVEVADLDGDGHPDIVASAAGTVVLLGQGDGTFAGPVASGSVGLADLVLADLDGDTELDAVGHSGGSVGVQLGDGSGGFGGLLSASAGTPLRDLALADVDGDGLADAVGLASSSTLEAVVVLPGLSGGTFGAPRQHLAAHNPRALASTDVDFDGLADVVVSGGEQAPLTQRPASTVTLFGGPGGLRGSYGASVPPRPFWCFVGDIDGDGLDDAFVPSQGASPLDPDFATSLLTTSSGPVSVDAFAPGGSELPFVLADFDGDEVLDVLVYDQATSPDRFGVRPGDGTGHFGALVPTSIPLGPVSHVQAADFDEDGRLDVAAVVSGNALWTLAGNGDGTFAAPQQVSAGSYFSLAVGRADGDAHVDLAVSFQGTVSTFLGNGDGTFSPGATADVVENVVALALADLDGDGDGDVVARTFDAFDPPGLNPNYLAIALRHSDGTYLPASIVHVGDGPLLDVGFNGLAIADFDGAGTLDVAVLLRDAGSLVVFAGNGDGTVAPALSVPAGFGPSWLAPADLDDDGITDLVVVDPLFITLGGAPAPAGRLWFLTNAAGDGE